MHNVDQKLLLRLKDLAEKLKIPRQTIKDWITTYSDFIRFERRGGITYYGRDTILALGYIRDFRNKGFETAEIKERLSKMDFAKKIIADKERVEFQKIILEQGQLLSELEKKIIDLAKLTSKSLDIVDDHQKILKCSGLRSLAVM